MFWGEVPLNFPCNLFSFFLTKDFKKSLFVMGVEVIQHKNYPFCFFIYLGYQFFYNLCKIFLLPMFGYKYIPLLPLRFNCNKQIECSVTLIFIIVTLEPAWVHSYLIFCFTY